MSDTHKTSLLHEVASYYTETLSKYGETPKGVDWNGEESQQLRFEQLCKILPPKAVTFSLNDLGCGYGALLEFLAERYTEVSYCGIDISSDMVNAAQTRYAGVAGARFICAAEPDSIADYAFASGIFNVRQGRQDEEWYAYIQDMLDVLDRNSRLGFAFNCLTSYSDESMKRNYLYYAEPCGLFDYCKRRYSTQVALLHDYGLYEFTILVRKA